MPPLPFAPPYEAFNRGGALHSAAPCALQSSYCAAKTDIDGLRAKLAAFRQQPLNHDKTPQSPRQCLQLQLQSLEQPITATTFSASYPTNATPGNPSSSYPFGAVQSLDPVTNAGSTCTKASSAFEGYSLDAHELQAGPSRPPSTTSRASLEVLYMASRPPPSNPSPCTSPVPPVFYPSAYPPSTSSSTTAAAAARQAVDAVQVNPPYLCTAATAYSERSSSKCNQAGNAKKASKNQPGSGSAQRKAQMAPNSKRCAAFGDMKWNEMKSEERRDSANDDHRIFHEATASGHASDHLQALCMAGNITMYCLPQLAHLVYLSNGWLVHEMEISNILGQYEAGVWRLVQIIKAG